MCRATGPKGWCLAAPSEGERTHRAVSPLRVAGATSPKEGLGATTLDQQGGAGDLSKVGEDLLGRRIFEVGGRNLPKKVNHERRR
jgi:hypothetical protein